MEGIITGAVVGAIVALVGAGVNYVASSRRDGKQRNHEVRVQRERWEREDRIRYHEERLSTYRSMYNAVDEENLGFYRSDPMEDFLFVGEDFDEGMRDLSLYHAEVLLLATTKEVRQASVKIGQEAFLLSRKVQSIPSGSTITRDEGGSWLDDLLEAGSEFLRAARKELGIEDQDS